MSALAQCPITTRFTCDTILLNTYQRSLNTSLAVYINGKLARGYRTDRLANVDGVEKLPWHSYALEGSNLLGCQSFDLPVGKCYRDKTI